MLRYVEQMVVWLLVVVFVGMAVHTPVTVYIESHWPAYELLAKSWKELVLGVVAVGIFVSVWRRGLLGVLVRDRLILLVAAIAALHVVLLLAFDNSYVSEYAGLLIDLRFYLLFVEVYIVARYFEDIRPQLLWATGIGVGIVLGFGALQVMVLPKDILSYIGYGQETIAPYLTVDLNHDYVRINSTLRGPNPVGAFAVLTLGLAVAWALSHGKRLTERRIHSLVLGVLLGSLMLLIASYSRSAWLAAAVVVAALTVSVLPHRAALYSIVSMLCVGGLALGMLFAFRDNPTISNLFFHNNPSSSSVEKSDDGHATSLQYGAAATVAAPAGHGVGSTGSASLLGDKPVIVENQYFFMAHESGWLGLLLQLGLFGAVLFGLWRSRQNWLSLGVFATGVGLALIGILLPVWADDTVSLYWWGLAGLALGPSAIIKPYEAKSASRKSHKKTARTA